jgi:hypothetical protein
MHHPLRRAAVGATIAAAAALALPGMASAFSSCSYDAVTKRVTVSDGSGDDGRLQVTQSGQFVAIRDLPLAGAATLPIQLCTNGSVAATVTNTDRVLVQGRSRGGSDDYLISLMGPGATEELDGNSELEVQVQQLSNVSATLTISGTAGNDTIKAGGANLVMLGPDSDVDTPTSCTARAATTRSSRSTTRVTWSMTAAARTSPPSTSATTSTATSRAASSARLAACS